MDKIVNHKMFLDYFTRENRRRMHWVRSKVYGKQYVGSVT